MALLDLWSHHRAALLALAALGGAAQAWLLARGLRDAGEDAAGLDQTIRERSHRGWVHLHGSSSDRLVTLTVVGRRLLLAAGDVGGAARQLRALPASH